MQRVIEGHDHAKERREDPRLEEASDRTGKGIVGLSVYHVFITFMLKYPANR